MFNEVYDLEDAIKALELERILFERIDGHSGSILDSDTFYTNAFEVMAINLDAEVIGLEHTDSTLYKFNFPELHTFYTLCKEYSKVNRINFRKNPYVKAAGKFVDDTFRHSGADSFAWNLWVPPKLVKKRAYTVIVETGTYFDDYIEIIDTLYEIKDYYAKQIEALKKELHGNAKIIKLPATDTKERRAA